MANRPGASPPAETESAGPTGIGTGAEEGAARLPYHHPDRQAIRERTAAEERVLRVVAAFAALQPEERRDAADQIIALAATGAPLPAFVDMQEEADSWTVFADAAELAVYGVAIAAELRRRGREELRALFAAAWRALPETDRLAFLTRATGGRGTA